MVCDWHHDDNVEEPKTDQHLLWGQHEPLSDPDIRTPMLLTLGVGNTLILPSPLHSAVHVKTVGSECHACKVQLDFRMALDRQVVLRWGSARVPGFGRGLGKKRCGGRWGKKNFDSLRKICMHFCSR